MESHIIYSRGSTPCKYPYTIAQASFMSPTTKTCRNWASGKARKRDLNGVRTDFDYTINIHFYCMVRWRWLGLVFCNVVVDPKYPDKSFSVTVFNGSLQTTGTTNGAKYIVNNSNWPTETQFQSFPSLLFICRVRLTVASDIPTHISTPPTPIPTSCPCIDKLRLIHTSSE